MEDDNKKRGVEEWRPDFWFSNCLSSVATNGGMMCDLPMDVEVFRTHFKVLVQHLSEELRKVTTSLAQDSQHPDRNMILGNPEYEAGEWRYAKGGSEKDEEYTAKVCFLYS